MGAALTADKKRNLLYLWGGRQSKEMTPCDASLWVYDVARDTWTTVKADEDAGGENKVPAERSYHCMAVLGDELFRKRLVSSVLAVQLAKLYALQYTPDARPLEDFQPCIRCLFPLHHRQHGTAFHPLRNQEEAAPFFAHSAFLHPPAKS